MAKKRLITLYEFIKSAENLKREVRHSWLSNGRQESVAEHSWRMSLMALLLEKELVSRVDLVKVLKMIVIHDIAEMEAGDIPAMRTLKDPKIKELKNKNELIAIENIKKILGNSVGDEIYDLWQEFELKKTTEAKFVNALDKLEVQIQHNQASLDTWEDFEFDMIHMMDKHVQFDAILIQLKDLVVKEAEEKIEN